MSKRLDIGNLPSRRGNKKQKVDSSTPSTTPVVVLDNIAFVAKPKVDASLTHPDVDPSKPPPVGPLDSGPLTILRSEAVTNKDVAICYDMSVKEFERSIVNEKL